MKPLGQLPGPAVLLAMEQEMPHSLAGVCVALPCPGHPGAAGGRPGCPLNYACRNGVPGKHSPAPRRPPGQEWAAAAAGQAEQQR